MNLNSISAKEIRRFGAIALVFFGFLCSIGFWMEKPLPSYLFLSISLISIGFILLPYQFKPVYAVWRKCANLLGSILTIVLLTVVYYIIITPSAFIKMLLGGRPLPIKPDKKAKTYWVTRTEPVQPIERFTKRF